MRPALALLVLPALVSGAYAADIKGTSRIDAVIVFPSGAEVTRVGKVRLEAGDHVILFADLPARAIASSIRVEGKATAKLEIGSVDSRRMFVPRTDDAVAATERKRVEDAIEKLKDDRALLQAAVQAAEAQKTLIGNLAQLPSRPAPATGAAAPQPDWTQIFGIIGQRFAEAQKAILETQVKMREVDRQIKDLEGKLASLAPAQDERTEVKIFVNAAAPLEADIAIRYQVGAASWVPFYDARLATGTKAQAPKLQLVRRASIQQRSGESWDDVALALSTTRPGAGTAAPELQPVTVDYEPDAPQRPIPPVVECATLAGARELREADRVAAASEDVRRAQIGAGASTRPGRGSARPGRDAGLPGHLRHCRPRHRAADGRGQARADRRGPARPRADGAHRAQARPEGLPLRQGGDGARHADPAGPSLALPRRHLRRQWPRCRSWRRARSTSWASASTMRCACATPSPRRSAPRPASSRHPRPTRAAIASPSRTCTSGAIPVTVIDQIPVSQNGDIKIELLGKTAPTKRDLDDKRGVLAWEMTLQPDEEKAVEFGYRVTWPGAKKITYGQGS